MIDESIEFGHEKLLVILGIRKANIDFKRALHYPVTYLKLTASESWKGENFQKVLDELTQEIGTIKYTVAGMGNFIKKVLRLSTITYIEDINHKISWLIKELYKGDKENLSPTPKSSHILHGSMGLSNKSHILPSGERVNSRYMDKRVFNKYGKSSRRE